MKITYFYLLFISIVVFGCGNLLKVSNTTYTEEINETQKVDTIFISNQRDFNLTFIDKGFYDWLKNQDPKTDFYESSLEIKNLQYVTEWNRRVNNPSIFNKNLYSQKIFYKVNPDTHYGLDVNYNLYLYFKFFEHKHEKLLKSNN